jgi:hypothetical protein
LKEGSFVPPQGVYPRFIDWSQQLWELPETDALFPLIMTASAPEKEALVTGMPFSGRNPEELSEMKEMVPDTPPNLPART